MSGSQTYDSTQRVGGRTSQMSSQRFLASAHARLLPDWIRKHQVFVDNKQIRKVFSQIGLPNERVKQFCTDPQFGPVDLMFSASGVRGLYDIATMSQRGVMSCMNWNNRHSSHLIGSMVDPFCSLIYLTDGRRTDLGKQIVRRCVVRLVESGGVPTLFLERPYAMTANRDPHTYDNKCTDPNLTIERFADYLRGRTTLPVAHSWQPWQRRYIPRDVTLRSLKPNQYTLSDGGLGYSGDRELGQRWLAELHLPTRQKCGQPLTATRRVATMAHKLDNEPLTLLRAI